MPKKKHLTLKQLIKKFQAHSRICQKQFIENNENFDLPGALRTMCVEIEKIKKAQIDLIYKEISQNAKKKRKKTAESVDSTRSEA